MTLFKRCMAFDGRTDPDHGYEEKSPCTNVKLQFHARYLIKLKK